MTPHAPAGKSRRNREPTFAYSRAAGRRLRPSDCRNVREMAQEYRLISQKQGRWSCTPRRTRKPDFSRLASSNQALLRHPGVSPYRCCLPALAGFEGSCRAGPDLQRHLAEADSNLRALRWGIRPRVERISGAAKAAKAPLAPHLARPGGNDTRTTQKRKWLGVRPPTLPTFVAPLTASWGYSRAAGRQPFISGEGGIRTRVGFLQTRSPGVRVRPDYATSPIAGIGIPATVRIIP